MRVAHFIQRYPPALGGSESYFARLARYLYDAGDQVAVFTSNAIDLEAFWSRFGNCISPGTSIESGIEVCRYPLWRWPARRYMLKTLSIFPNRLWQCMTMPCNPISRAMWRDAGRPKHSFDVVHASAFPYAWPIACARRLARTQSIPFLLTPFLHVGDRGDPHDATRRQYTAPHLRWLLRQADIVFVQTPSERETCRALGVPNERLVLQGLGVDPAECTGGNLRKARLAWNVAEHEVVIGHLANNSWEKGTVDLLRAATMLWQRGLRFRIVLAGPEMPNFRAFWDRASGEIKRRTVRLGVLDEAQKRDVFAGIDVFALPSRSDSFGLVLLEAWANGLPNIAFRAGGPADLIQHEEDGLLVPCGDIEKLAGAMERLVKDGSLRHKLGASGKDRCQREFRWEDKLNLVRQTLRLAASQRRARNASAKRKRVKE
ncbi:MAG: glycosyltransferase family 4 protein [Planctomycetes bacterium]|nr:glycosyltransferase family 4 protein [Planctomycetota bacterium]